ncbi:hypothetical protein Oweho_0907 [Owenweeksia hongkongensis DSM 17368]|uniref:Uncharacterized protein n=1 Tax=Owenweeksia hongkongensis (strain DSM 17368 / CIP 108786 / JCM 12287 / NRRL B-23963 / UST20020801) TaxID=926562 RepID=G8R397_OWEHD|nr:hypothetical protein Oweho_0907 [Owenweeksia hongkongensis DSM 17368]
MRSGLLYLLCFLFIISCNTPERLDGLWFIAYSKDKGEKADFRGARNLLHFHGSEVHTIQAGDFAANKLNRISIDTSKYQLNDTILNLWGENISCRITSDSIVLSQFLGIEGMVILLPLKHQGFEVEHNFFKDSWSFQYFGFEDTLDFINDSLFIHTGDLNVYLPTESWSTFEYNGITFLLFNSGILPWMAPITKCTEDTILFENIYRPKQNIALFKVESVSRHNQLIGTWRQGHPDDDRQPPPPSPGMTEADRPIKMTFGPDSVTLTKWDGEETLKWDLTSDGKRIYFIDKIKEKWGSGKIVRLTDDHLFLRMSGNSMEEDTLKLFRVQ